MGVQCAHRNCFGRKEVEKSCMPAYFCVGEFYNRHTKNYHQIWLSLIFDNPESLKIESLPRNHYCWGSPKFWAQATSDLVNGPEWIEIQGQCSKKIVPVSYLWCVFVIRKLISEPASSSLQMNRRQTPFCHDIPCSKMTSSKLEQFSEII